MRLRLLHHPDKAKPLPRTKIAGVLLSCLAVLWVFVSSGCKSNNQTPIVTQDSIPKSAREILINNRRFHKPYRVLGPVTHTIKRYTSIFTDQAELRDEAIALIKQEALTRYGSKVDAIIDTNVDENTVEGYDGTLSVIRVEGVAVAFMSGVRKDNLRNSRIRVNKKRASKSKAANIKQGKSTGTNKNAQSTSEFQEDDIEISPEEILK